MFELVLILISASLIGILIGVSYYFLFILKAWKKSNELYLLNSKKEYFFNSCKEYIGVVITNSDLPEKKYTFVFWSGPILLLEHLKSKKSNFKLLKEDDKENKFNTEEFEKMLKDEKCKELYILGHGRHYCLRIGKDKNDKLFYDKYKGFPSKLKVVQLHCNHAKIWDKDRKRSSLTDMLNAESDFEQKNIRNNWDNVRYFLDKIKKNVK